MIKIRGMRWTGLVAHMEMKHTQVYDRFESLNGRDHSKDLGEDRGNITIELKEIG
jgi:hypothetical protein